MRFWISFAAAFLAAAVVLSLCPVRGEGELYGDVLRLRVIAASDEEEDQAAKLAVRDAVLELLTDTVAACGSREEAEAAVVGLQEEVERAAGECLAERGMDAAVHAGIGWERCPRRDYGDAVLPGGYYRTLRVTIGDGEGHNWWCVLFPGICVRYAEKNGSSREESLAVGLTPEEYRIITGAGDGKFRIRFWILEKLGELCGIPAGES